MPTFQDLPRPIQIAAAFRAELEHFGWDDHAFIGYGCTLTNIPLEAVALVPPNSTLISVHLRLPGRPVEDEFVITCGYVDNTAWPEAGIVAAFESWNVLSQADRTAVRKKFVTPFDAGRLVRRLVERGFLIPPRLASTLSDIVPAGEN